MIVPVMFSGTEGPSILYINIHDISRPQCLISLFACLLYVNTVALVSPSLGTCKTHWAVSRNTVGRDRGTLKVYDSISPKTFHGVHGCFSGFRSRTHLRAKSSAGTQEKTGQGVVVRARHYLFAKSFSNFNNSIFAFTSEAGSKYSKTKGPE